jgi:hypothetical protein
LLFYGLIREIKKVNFGKKYLLSIFLNRESDRFSNIWRDFYFGGKMKRIHVSNRSILKGMLIMYLSLNLIEIIERVYFTKQS